jgi:hypothetical protein
VQPWISILLCGKVVCALAVLGAFRGAGEKKSLMLFFWGFCGFIVGNNRGVVYKVTVWGVQVREASRVGQNPAERDHTLSRGQDCGHLARFICR